MVLLTTLFSLACAAMPSADAPLLTADGNDIRVPFAAGLAEIYRDACGVLTEGDDAASQQSCIDDAVAMVTQDLEMVEYGQCDALGGVLVHRIPLCAAATLQVALLTENSSLAELASAATAAHRQCTAAVLCEGAEPEELQDGVFHTMGRP